MCKLNTFTCAHVLLVEAKGIVILYCSMKLKACGLIHLGNARAPGEFISTW